VPVVFGGKREKQAILDWSFGMLRRAGHEWVANILPLIPHLLLVRRLIEVGADCGHVSAQTKDTNSLRLGLEVSAAALANPVPALSSWS
jgi:hypothetical protein